MFFSVTLKQGCPLNPFNPWSSKYTHTAWLPLIPCVPCSKHKTHNIQHSRHIVSKMADKIKTDKNMISQTADSGQLQEGNTSGNIVVMPIENMILSIRGQQVILDRDLARLYQVETSQMNRQVKRNIERFPNDFRFQLTKEEFDSLKCQNGISNRGGDRRELPSRTSANGGVLSPVWRYSPQMS